MPVPAVCGGAIETLIESFLKRYSKEEEFRLTVFSVYHKEAVKAAKKYPNVRFVWTHTNTFWNLAKHSVFLTVRELTGTTIRVLQRHYNEIAPIIRNEKFDLLIAEGGDAKAVIDIAKGYKREQLVLHAHTHVVPDEEVAEGYGNVIGVSKFVVREYEKACKFPVDTFVLKNAIDIDKFHQKISEEERKTLRKQLGLQEDDFVVLYVGRLLQVKGIQELMQAVLSIPDENVKLLCVGSANFGKQAFSFYERTVKSLAKAHQDRIKFTGYIDNKEIYKYGLLADIQCVPSLCEEAAGLVAIEAMTEGIPTIVTNSGGMIEYVNEGTSLIVDRKDIIENLRRSILYLRDHPEERKQMSEQSRIQGLRYNESIYYQEFVEIIDKIAEKNGTNKNAD